MRDLVNHGSRMWFPVASETLNRASITLEARTRQRIRDWTTLLATVPGAKSLWTRGECLLATASDEVLELSLRQETQRERRRTHSGIHIALRFLP